MTCPNLSDQWQKYNLIWMTLKKIWTKLLKRSRRCPTRYRKFDDFIKSINTGLHERDKKTDEKIERLEGQINTKIDEKFAGLETRIGAIERGTTEAGCRRLDNAQGKSGHVPTECKAVLHGFKTESKEQGRESYCHEVNQCHWNERRTHTWLSGNPNNTRLCRIWRHKD